MCHIALLAEVTVRVPNPANAGSKGMLRGGHPPSTAKWKAALFLVRSLMRHHPKVRNDTLLLTRTLEYSLNGGLLGRVCTRPTASQH